MLKKFKDLARQYNALKTDWERLTFLKEHRTEMKAVLDNDMTMVEFIKPNVVDDDEWELVCDLELESFDDYHYWSDGCLLLFKFAGITAESC